MQFQCSNSLVNTNRPSQSVFLCLLQEDVGHRELCVIHLVEEHARERPAEGHRLPHEEEPITARSQAEGPVSRSGTDKLPGGAKWSQVIWREVLQCHHDGRVLDRLICIILFVEIWLIFLFSLISPPSSLFDNPHPCSPHPSAPGQGVDGDLVGGGTLRG